MLGSHQTSMRNSLQMGGFYPTGLGATGKGAPEDALDEAGCQYCLLLLGHRGVLREGDFPDHGVTRLDGDRSLRDDLGVRVRLDC